MPSLKTAASVAGKLDVPQRIANCTSFETKTRTLHSSASLPLFGVELAEVDQHGA